MEAPDTITEIRGDAVRSNAPAVQNDSDRSLNYAPDQEPDIRQQLRQLNWKRGGQQVLEVAGTVSSAVMLGAASAFLLKRRIISASMCVLGFLVQQALKGQRAAAVPEGQTERERSDMELERYALKLQRGDYGKLEVIPFR